MDIQNTVPLLRDLERDFAAIELAMMSGFEVLPDTLIEVRRTVQSLLRECGLVPDPQVDRAVAGMRAVIEQSQRALRVPKGGMN